MNYLFVTFILVLILSLAFGGHCDLNPTDLQNKSINYDACGREMRCVFKCCLENEVIHRSKRSFTCKNIDVLRKELGSDLSGILKFSDIDVYDSNIYRSEAVLKSHRNFTLIHSDIYMNNSCSRIKTDQLKLLENGDAVIRQPNSYDYWIHFEPHKFCVDVTVGKINKTIVSKYIFKLRSDEKNHDDFTTNIFNAVAMSVSCCFLLLVLAVYLLLHQLRNIQGMLLSAYVATLMCSYAVKATQNFYMYYRFKRWGQVADTTVLTQIFYFACLSSFFWLQVMSFDIWWTFRGVRKLREIHRRGIRAKFAMYSAYAYGVPAAMTVAAVLADAAELPYYVAKPQFHTRLTSSSVFVYLYVPLIILTCTNCVFFIMTVYNIWLTHRRIRHFDKKLTKKNRKNKNRFWVYIKLSSLTGVGYVVEMAQARTPPGMLPVWLYVLINSYTTLCGLVIFFMFLFKRSIFVMLCRRLNIENRFTRALQVNSSTRSEVSRSDKRCSRVRSVTECEADGAGGRPERDEHTRFTGRSTDQSDTDDAQ